MFLSNLQEHDFSVVHVEAYLRSLTLNEEDLVGRWILYIWLPHPAVHQNQGQFQVHQA